MQKKQYSQGCGSCFPSSGRNLAVLYLRHILLCGAYLCSVPYDEEANARFLGGGSRPDSCLRDFGECQKTVDVAMNLPTMRFFIGQQDLQGNES